MENNNELIKHLKPETQALALKVNTLFEPVPYILEALEDIEKEVTFKDENSKQKVLEILAVLSEKIADWEDEAIEDDMPLGIGDIISAWLPRTR